MQYQRKNSLFLKLNKCFKNYTTTYCKNSQNHLKAYLLVFVILVQLWLSKLSTIPSTIKTCYKYIGMWLVNLVHFFHVFYRFCILAFIFLSGQCISDWKIRYHYFSLSRVYNSIQLHSHFFVRSHLWQSQKVLGTFQQIKSI